MKKALLCLSFLLCVGSVWSMTEAERRNYLEWMKQSLPQVEQWTQWQEKTGELPPDFDALPKQNLLPDPLRFSDGRQVGSSPADWDARRAEIKKLIEKYVTGTFPPKPAIDKVELLDETRGEGYTTRNVRLIFGPEGKGNVRVSLVIPDAAPGEKLPVMISPNLNGWATMLVRRGYISAGYAGNDGMDDGRNLSELYPDYNFATLPHRAWVASIVIDYLATLPVVDMKCIAINGYSRDGKMATIAAAFDDRIGALVAGSTGVGGVVPWRLSGERGGGESIESTTRMFPDWFIPQLRFFSGHEDRLPVDGHFYLALMAPRAALLEWGLNDEVANGWAQEQAYQSALKVYQRFGQPTRLSMMPVPGFHGSNDQEACMDWVDYQFGRTPKVWHNDFKFSWNYDEWTGFSGEKVNTADYPVYSPVKKVTRKEWDAKASAVRESIEWMLGDTPPAMAPAAAGAGRMGGRFGGANVGVTAIARGEAPNPGQLAPDVPAWVIRRGSGEFGWTAEDNKAADSRRIRFGGVSGDLFFPAGTPEGTKLPTVIWLHGFHHPLGYMWVYRRDIHPVLALVKAGYAVLAYDQTGYGTRWNEADPFYYRYPHWSRMGKMVEDLRNAVTTLESDAVVDASKISVLGYTMGGTLGLYGAALDDRIKAVVSVSGFTPMRSDTVDKGTSGMTRYSHQHGLIPRLGFFAGNENRLPYDYDEVISLAAPRPVLIVQPTMDRDASPADVRAAVENARKVYDLDKAGDKLELMEPVDYARFTAATQDKVIEWLNNNAK